MFSKSKMTARAQVTLGRLNYNKAPNLKKQSTRIVTHVFFMIVVSPQFLQFSAAAFGHELLEKNQSFPLCPPMAESGERFRVGSFSNMDKLFPSNVVYQVQ